MDNVLRVNPAELQVSGVAWHMEAGELHAVPPSLDAASGWSTMLAAAAVTGAAQAATADLHTQTTTTAGATQVAGTRYESMDYQAADMVKNVITAVTDAVRRTT